ncbi:MAG TPA: hypothetical protein VK922_19165 [Gemmatimonadaceae bacterium]|nr:hypothetical protein [Gemmatimonadaceae bacterium]
MVLTGLLLAAQLAAQPALAPRTIAIDERLAQDAGLAVGDRVVIAAEPDEPGDTVVIGAITRRGADPSEIARAEPRIRGRLGGAPVAGAGTGFFETYR